MVNRVVHITSLSFRDKSKEEIIPLVEQEASKGCDLIVLPECWTGETPETVEEGTTAQLQKIAEKWHVYIVNAVALSSAQHPRTNSSILIDRNGKIQGIYSKMYPFWNEFDQTPPVFIGEDAPVFETDFGRLGMAICFDANFNEVWERLSDNQADIVVWSSAYSAGTSLQAHAINYNYAIVSSTWVGDCVAYDINGEEIFYQKAENEQDVLISHVEIDTNRAIFHENFNWYEKKDKLLAEHPDVTLEQYKWREQWFVLKGSSETQIKELAKQYQMEELPAYKRRSRDEINKMRLLQQKRD